jgi:hypothetical protein
MAIFGGRDKNTDDDGRAKALPANAYRGLTASAARIDLTNKDEVDRLKQRKVTDTWQTDAWEYFDAIGEIKYSGNLIGAVLSRVRLYPAYNVDPDQAPAHVSDAASADTVTLPDDFAESSDRVLRRLDSANGGLSGLLNRAGVNIWVAGECYLVQQPAKTGSDIPERWDIKSVDELVVGTSGELSLKTTRDAKKNEPLPKGAFAGRIWRSHPRFSDESDSSIRAIRDLADEVLLYARTGKVTARSRLNAGAIYLPDGLSVAGEADEDDELDESTEEVIEDAKEEDDEFERELLESMSTPIADEASAAALVPLIIRGPAELGEKIKQFKFERSMDPVLIERADRALERLLQGLDMPKDIVSGLASVKYANAVHINEQLYQAHIEPLILLICDALTAVYFRPALKAMGFNQSIINKAMIWYDPSEILTKPDRADAANDGYDRKALSGNAWRKAHGFSEADAPTPEEQLKRAALERAPMTPELATEIFKAIAPTMLEALRQAALAANPAGPLPQQASDILSGVPESPATGPSAPPNPALQPPAPPAPPTPTTPAPETPAPARPTPVGIAQ